MRRFAALRVFLLCAVLVANNLHLPLLQVTAWVRMLFTYSQDNSVATAIELAKRLSGEPGVAVNVRHRDLGRE